MNNKNIITKAVIPMGGLGTRFFPYTNIADKALINILNVPLIHYIYTELKNAGIKEVLLITNSVDKIDKYLNLNNFCDEKNEYVSQIMELDKALKIETLSTSGINNTTLLHSLSYIKTFVGKDPFVLAFCDEFLLNDPVKDMVDIYNKTKQNVVLTLKISKKERHKYGVAELQKSGDHFKVTKMIEKPKLKDTKSKTIMVGRYVFNNSALRHIDELVKKYNNTKNPAMLNVVDLLNEVAKEEEIYAKIIKDDYYNCGDVDSYLKSTIKIAKKRKLM